MIRDRRPSRPDRGSILPLVMLVAILLSAVVVALARLVTTDLAAGRVTAARAERQATALSAIDYAIERFRTGSTVCDATVPQFGQVAAGLVDLNGATTSLSCDRPVPHVAFSSDWAAIITGEGSVLDQLRWSGTGTGQLVGRVFVSDPGTISLAAGSGVEQNDGDLWYDEPDCAGAGATVPASYVFFPDTTHGPRCTTIAWDELVAAPAIAPDGIAPAPEWIGTCRVFSPGRYTTAPDLGPEVALDPRPPVYFNSGVYVFDDVGDVVITDQPVWFGHNGAATPMVANPDCESARTFDLQTAGPGAVVYMGGDSRIVLDGTASVEFFGFAQDGQQVSLQQLTSGPDVSTVTADGTDALVAIDPAGAEATLVSHGLVYAPEARLDLEQATGTSFQQFLGGVVAAQLWLRADPDTGMVAVPRGRVLTIGVTAVATDERGETTARAIVEYRPDEPDAANRLTVISLRVVD